MEAQSQESTKTMTAETVFESFFDDDSGVWTLRRVALDASEQDHS